ncbi:MAG TPA: methyl-accepting chemotaxis protein [Terracidiphilus sp.]|nr:methyl-accepting chemotaxis protein [Terracidiphilus sp.]
MPQTLHDAASRFAIIDRLTDLVHIWVEQTGPLLAIAEMIRDVRDLEQRNRQMASAAEEMSASIREIAFSGSQASNDAQDLKVELATTTSAVNATASAMEEIHSAFGAISERMQILTHASTQISDLLQSIRDIATKTNVLALNATIEAARAGEAGKGFSVVAKEVRELAEQTAAATREIDRRVAELQNGITGAQQSMDLGTSRVSAGNEQIKVAADAVDSVDRLMDSVVRKILQVSTATEEQGIVTSDLSRNIAEILPTVAQTQKSIDLLVKAVQRAGIFVGQRLREMNPDMDAATLIMFTKADHATFKKRIIETLIGQGSTTSAELPDRDSCRLGRWYASQTDPNLRSMPEFRAIEAPHRRVHEHGTLALQCYENRDFAGALSEAGKLDEASRLIIDALDLLYAKLTEERGKVVDIRNKSDHQSSHFLKRILTGSERQAG